MKRRKFVALLGSLFLVLVLVLPLMSGCTGEGTPERPEIILGAPLALGYPDGTCALDNLELAVDEINAGAGVDVNGTAYNFKLVWGDTKDLEPGASLEQALAVVEYLITSQNADFIIGGPIRSDIALSAMDLGYDNDTVMVWSAGFLSPCFKCRFDSCPPPGNPPCPAFAANYTKYKYCFRTQGNAADMAVECADIMEWISNNMSLDKEACIICQQVSHAVGAVMGLKGILEGTYGWTVHSVDQIPTGTVDFSTVLLTANATGAPFLVPWFDMPESANLIKQWYDYQLPMLPIGFVVPLHDSLAWSAFTTGAGVNKCEYVINDYPKAGVTAINTEAAHYISEYVANINPAGPGETWVAPTSYQAVFILKDAIEDAGSIDPLDVITALEAYNETGVYGNMHFVNHEMVQSSDPATGAVSTWVQWQEVSGSGERVPVYPSTVGDLSDIVLPDWM